MSILAKLKDDFSNIDEILSSYDKEIERAKSRININGRQLAECIVEQSTWYGFYDEKKAELKTLCNFIEGAIKVKRGQLYEKVIKTSTISHTERGREKLVDASPNLKFLNSLLLEIQDCYMRMDSVVKAFEQRSYSLNNLVKLYERDLEEVVVSY